jgi:signal transduction histidine kinase
MDYLSTHDTVGYYSLVIGRGWLEIGMTVIHSHSELVNESKVLPVDETILIVDDDPRVIEVLRGILEQEGCKIISAVTGQSALERLRQVVPAVVLLDLNLPDIDGIALCQTIKETFKHRFVPVLLVTGESDRSKRLAGLQAGADDFLSKPINPPEILARVRTLLRTRRLYDDLERSKQTLEARVQERTQELQAAYERLKELNQVKGNVLAIVSHELRTPLMQARSALDLAFHKNIPEAEQVRLLSIAQDAFVRLEHRIGDISVFSDTSDLRFVSVSTRGLIERAVHQVTVHHNPSPTIDLVMESNLPPVYVDVEAISRVLVHLVENAVKYGEQKPVSVTALKEESGIRITISDQGSGISDELLPHLFKPLHQGDHSVTRRQPGMGIGLALCKMILDSHYIDLTLASSRSGTRASLILPLYKD